MGRRLLTICFLGLLLAGGGQEILAQPSCATAQLRSMALGIGLDSRLSEGLNYRVMEFRSVPVSVIVRDGEVVHIGYSLFTPFQRSYMPEGQCNFIERLILASDLGEFYGKSFQKHLAEERIRFEKGSVVDLKAMCLDTNTYFQITLQNDKRYICNWYSENRRGVTLSYPADYQLLKGATIQESENRLAQEVRRFRVGKEEPVNPAEQILIRSGNSPIYVLTGEIFHLPELNSNRYFVVDPDSGWQLLYGEDFPLESMANLVTGIELETDIEVAVTQVKYGYNRDEFTVPLRQWVGYCIQQGCRPFFGIISEEGGGGVVAELVMNNPEMGYAHVMKLSFQSDIIKERRGTVKARLNAYVPMSNLKSLFNENEIH